MTTRRPSVAIRRSRRRTRARASASASSGPAHGPTPVAALLASDHSPEERLQTSAPAPPRPS
eukprot:11751363-Alexandrium_andersonii.AAC.1